MQLVEHRSVCFVPRLRTGKLRHMGHGRGAVYYSFNIGDRCHGSRVDRNLESGDSAALQGQSFFLFTLIEPIGYCTAITATTATSVALSGIVSLRVDLATDAKHRDGTLLRERCPDQIVLDGWMRAFVQK